MKPAARRGPDLPLLVASLLVTALFVLRPIPLTSDDGFYVEYFSGYREYGDVLLFAMIDEPLFKADAVGVIEAEDPGEIDELARDLGLDDESAEWLKELLDEDDDLLP